MIYKCFAEGQRLEACLLSGLSLFYFLFMGCVSPAQKESTPKISAVSIPFYFGFNNDNYPSDSTYITLRNAHDSLVFENKGYNPFWGLQRMGELPTTGKYTLHITFFPDSVTKKEVQESFEITGEEKQIDLSVNLRSGFNGIGNDVYLNKYFDNKYNAQLKRIWDPVKQYDSKKDFLPEYELTNTYDSTLFGIYRQFSSSSTVHWVRNWNIAYMRFQKFNGSEWEYLECAGPRMDATLKKDSTGKTLKDMVLSCPDSLFKVNQRYRVLVEYGINDAVYRNTPATTRFDSSFYYEPHIYRVADEFSLK